MKVLRWFIGGKKKNHALNAGKATGPELLRSRLGVLRPRKAEPGISCRSYSEHLIPFGLNPKKLRGKRILFVGVGDQDILGAARKDGIEAFGLEPNTHERTRQFESDRFLSKQSMQEYSNPKEPFDHVIAVWSVPHYLERAFDVRLSFFNMLSSLKVGGSAILTPIQFVPGKKTLSSPTGWVAPSLKRKIEAAGFEIVPISTKEMTKNCMRSGVFLPAHTAIRINRTEKSDINRLKELLTL